MYYITYCIIYFVPSSQPAEGSRVFFLLRGALPEGRKKYKGMRKCIRKRNKGSKNTTHFGADEGQNIIYFLVYTTVNEVFHNIIIKMHYNYF